MNRGAAADDDAADAAAADAAADDAADGDGMVVADFI
jgi:hypothetical protein